MKDTKNESEILRIISLIEKEVSNINLAIQHINNKINVKVGGIQEDMNKLNSANESIKKNKDQILSLLKKTDEK